ncbi:MAG: low temperature requirement protein A [Spirochaetales bacterium]|nr:low temperature requirement protein A [Spirochaetales bacterium]
MKNLMYHEDHRHATWLELFFDLIFVVLIGRITHILAHTHNGHLEMEYILKFPLMFIPVWWLWINHTIYSNLYDTDSKEHRFITLVIMLLMIGLSIFVDVDFEEVFYGFITLYSLIRFIIALLYRLSSGKHEGDRKHAELLGHIYMGTALLGFASIFLPVSLRYYVVYFSLVLDFILPVLLGGKMKSVSIHREHLVERIGLLIIIMLGESVISLVHTLNTIHWNWLNALAAFAGFVLIGGIWWILFDFIYLLFESEKIRKPYVLIFPSLLLFMGLSVIANLIRHAILDDLDVDSFRLLMGIGVVIFFLGKQISYYVLYEKIRKYIIQNTFIVFVICGLSMLLPRNEYMLVGMNVALFTYIAITFRYMIDEEIAVRHLHMKKERIEEKK